MIASQQCMRLDAGSPSPFDLDDNASYAAWRKARLSGYPCPSDPVSINDPRHLTNAEKHALLTRCQRYNFAVYRLTEAATDTDKSTIVELGRQLGLVRLDANLCADEDAITSIRVNPGKLHREYIPYTDHPLNWHTDGYYNATDHRVRGFILHCVRDAENGGDTGLLDPDIAYIRIRDHDPLALSALMHPRALTIPSNNIAGGAVRRAVSGPVFLVDPESGCLHMRYTARTRSVIWRHDRATQRAAGLLREILREKDACVVNRHLQPHEGVVSNNVLHRRTGFTNGADGDRLLYRARYYDRVANTEWYRQIEDFDALVE